VFHTIEHYDAVESTGDPQRARMLRLLTPLVKYHTARGAVQAASEAMELFGGDGYCETFVTARLLRDAQVLPIWEGTTHILVLDAWRVVQRDDVLECLLEQVSRRFEEAGDRSGLKEVEDVRDRFGPMKDPSFESQAREAFDQLIEVVQRSLLAPLL
jgi:acyl-CoA dehydrogenase